MQCFVSMPFGRKHTELGRPVDFDGVYDILIRPALDRAGVAAVRIDDFGPSGSLRADLVRAVATSELFLADVSLPNPNIFYELGIRHALASRGTVIVAAEGTEVAFDLSALRVLFYPIEPGDGLRFEDAQRRLEAVIRAALDHEAGDSPVHMALPELEKRLAGIQTTPARRSWSKSPVEQKTIQQLRSYSSTDEITAKLRGVESRGEELVQETPEGAKTLLDAYRAADDWPGLIAFINKLDPDIGGSLRVRQELALALSRSGDNEQARAVLQETLVQYPNNAESLSLLGRVHRELGDHEGAIAFYRQALDLDPTSTYAGVQAAKLTHTIRGADDPGLSVLVEQTRAALLQRYDGYPKTAWDVWDLATDLELSLLAADWREAIKTAYVIADSPDTWAIRSIRRTVQQYADRMDDPADVEQLAPIDEALAATETTSA